MKRKSLEKNKQILRILVYIMIIITLIFIGHIFSNQTKDIEYEIKTALVERIVDGDTIVTSIGTIRLLGINTPERRKYYYQEATDYLSFLEGEEVRLELGEKDFYQRQLGYIYYGDRFIQEEILANGLAHTYIYNEDQYSAILRKAEKTAINNELGIWKKSESEYAKCISLVEVNEIDPGEYIILKNKCDFDCPLYKWTIKDESTRMEELDFNINAGKIKTINFEGKYLNDAGDTIFLRDEEGLLVLWHRY